MSLIATLGLAALIQAPPAPPKSLQPLKARLDQICLRFRGRLGYSLKRLTDGQSIDFRGDERFPSASTIKTAVALEAIRQVEEGKLKWSDTREVPNDMAKRQPSAWSYYFKDGTKPTLDGWVHLAITVSDNTATMVLQDWLGTDAINARMRSLGLKNTRINGRGALSETEQRYRDMFGWGMTTPNEMRTLLELIYLNRAASPEGCSKLLRFLSQQYWDDWIGGYVPRHVKTATKSGAISRSRSDTGIVFSSRPYILTIYTDSQKDQRWTDDNEGDLAIQRICWIVWNTLHPESPVPCPGPKGKFGHTGGILD
jgi:beta-lactamase class A